MKTKITILVLVFMMLTMVLVTGCEKSDTSEVGEKEEVEQNDQSAKEEKKDEKSEPAIITMMLGSPTDPQSVYTAELVEEFNAEFEGLYEVEIEYTGGQAADILEKMKVLNSTGKLPTIVSRLHEDAGFTKLLIDNNRLMDIKPYFDEREEWKEYSLGDHVQDIITSSGGGAMYSVPYTGDVYIGLFYNKELLSQAGYDEFPATWEEFWVMCDELIKNDIIPVSMDTLESAWASMLISTASLSDSKEGISFLNTLFPTDFNNEYMETIFKTLKRIFDNYTTDDAAGINFAMAANNFFSEQTAIIANGPWMISRFSDTQYAKEGFEQKVGYAPFPGSAMIVERGLVGFEGISMDVSKQSQEGAIEWFAFRARPENVYKEAIQNGRLNPKLPVKSSDIEEKGPVYASYADAVAKVKTTLPCYQTRWDSATMYEVFAVELPNYVSGALKLEDLLAKMGESATNYVKNNID